MSIDGHYRLWMGLLAAFFALVILAGGCGTPVKPVARTSAPVTVATDEGAVTVEATTTSEADAMGAGSVKAESAGTVQTFGIDPGTLELLKMLLPLVPAACIFMLCYRLEMPDTYRVILVMLSVAAGFAPLLKWALFSQLAGG